MGDPIEDLILGNAQGGRAGKAPPPTFAVVRGIAPGDVDALQASVPAPTGGPRIATLRASHHAAARALAEGLSNPEASVVTGYSPSYLSGLRQDPAFSELIEFYKAQGAQVREDLMARLKLVGLSATDELLKRLEEDPDAWTKRELMDLAELTLHKAGHTKGAGGGGGPPPGPAKLEIAFVAAPPAETRFGGKLIEGNALQLETAGDE